MDVQFFPGDIVMYLPGPGGFPLHWGDDFDEFCQNAVVAEVIEVGDLDITIRLVEPRDHNIHIIFADEYKHVCFVNTIPNPLVYQTTPCDA